jgi:uncharacterized membrane protein YdjX (TVP38/TMEM64 family)
MEKFSVILVDILQTSGIFAPLAFISLHVLRQFVFVPVSLICMIGGVFFGVVYGTMYSLVGLTLASICFYVLFKRMPSLFRKVQRLKDKYLRKRVPFSIGQMAILRMIPLVQFHLISLCLIEATSGFKEYTKTSFVANIPLAVVYTMFGQWIGRLSPEWIILILAGLAVLFYLLRKREWVIKWDEFFATRST